MVANWAKYNGTEQLYRRVNKGIPNSIRGEVWKHVLEIDKVKHSEIFEVGVVWDMGCGLKMWCMGRSGGGPRSDLRMWVWSVSSGNEGAGKENIT